MLSLTDPISSLLGFWLAIFVLISAETSPNFVFISVNSENALSSLARITAFSLALLYHSLLIQITLSSIAGGLERLGTI